MTARLMSVKEMLSFANSLIKPNLLAFVLSSLGGLASAQEVPAVVIEQCQNKVNANELPGCLSSGAIAFTLLERATNADYFGPDAMQVVEICLEQNDDYSSSWSCVSIAAESAVETARLIGRDAISDTCVRAIADADVVGRLKTEGLQLRSIYDPSNKLYGGLFYQPFKGCPEPDQESNATPSAAVAFNVAECQAFAALDDFFSKRSANELRAILPSLEALPEDQRFAGLSEFGLGTSDIAIITSRMERHENEALGIAMLGLGLLERHHPDLVQEIMDMGEENDAFTEQFASGFLTIMIDGAIQGFENACGS